MFKRSFFKQLIFSAVVISFLFKLTIFGTAETITPTSTPTPISTINISSKAICSLPNSGIMCLTFDDGYSKTSIKTILNCLRENNIQCTFFIIGRCLKAYPELWQQAILDGHEIAYHSMKHEKLTDYNDSGILNDIKEWNKTARKILGDNYIIPKIARLPGGNGNTSKRILSIFNSIGYTVISWNLDSYYDVIKENMNKVTSKQIANYIIKHAAIGAISLQHFNKFDGPSVSLYIKTLKVKYKLGKVSDALISSSLN